MSNCLANGKMCYAGHFFGLFTYFLFELAGAASIW